MVTENKNNIIYKLYSKSINLQQMFSIKICILFRENLQKYQTLICSPSAVDTTFVSKYLGVEYMDYDSIKNLVNVSLSSYTFEIY